MSDLNKMQYRMIEQRLGDLADLLFQIGPKHEMSWADNQGNVWNFKIEMEENDTRK